MKTDKVLVNGLEVDLALAVDGIVVTKQADGFLVRGPDGRHDASVVRQGDKVFVAFEGRVFQVERVRGSRGVGPRSESGEFRAAMPGQIVDVFVREGDLVRSGQKLLVLEAMKTQQPIVAPFDGTVKALKVTKGQQVQEGDLLMIVIM
jgi:3-methylcrotonyl-CoA carboxylase alpha subunit